MTETAHMIARGAVLGLVAYCCAEYFRTNEIGWFFATLGWASCWLVAGAYAIARRARSTYEGKT